MYICGIDIIDHFNFVQIINLIEDLNCMYNNPFLRVVLVCLILFYSLEANSLNVERTPIKIDIQDTDTIQILAESDSLFVKGKFLYEKKDYLAAINFFLKSDSVINIHYGTDCPYYGYGKIWASSCYHKLGMDSIALEYSIYYDKQPIDKLLTHSSDSIVWIGLRLIDLEQIRNATEMLLKAALLEKQELGSNSYWYANTLNVCSGLFSKIGNFEKAIELGKESVEIYKAIFGVEHIEYAHSLNNLASIHSDFGNKNEALRLGSEAIGIIKKNVGTDDPEYTTSLSNLAYYYSEICNYREAIRLETEATKILKRIVGTDDPKYTMSLSRLTDYYLYLGNYYEALQIATEAIGIIKKNYGTEHPVYAMFLSDLAVCYSETGNYSEAIRLGTEAMEIRKRILGTDHPAYATSLNNLALNNSRVGNYSEAIRLGKEAMELYKITLGAEDSYYAMSLSNLAVCYSEVGNYSEAIRLGTEAMEIYKKIRGKEHPDYARSLHNLATYNAKVGNYSNALKFETEAIEIRIKIYGIEHPLYATSLLNFAGICSEVGNYSEAIRWGREAMEIIKEILGAGHPLYATALYHLAWYNIKLNNNNEAFKCLNQYLNHSQSYVIYNFTELSSRNREAMWTNKYAYIYNTLLPNIVKKYQTKQSFSELYDKTCLFAKGLLLNTGIEIRKLILESGDSVIIDKYNALASNVNVYNKLLEKPIKERIMDADSLKRVIEQQEMVLARDSKAYGDYTHNLTISWKDVQRGLGDNDIAIEFLNFPIYNSDSTIYVALTLKKDYDCPHMVKLFEEKQLKAISEDDYYTQTDVYGLVWKPLEEEFRDVRNIYYAPSGELHRMGIEYLPISKTKNINDEYTLLRLSSTRQLAVIQDEIEGKNTIIYGGINYDEKSSTISTESVSSEKTVLRSAVNRANVDSLSIRSSFDYLEGTKKEADMIAVDMKQHRVPYIYYSGTRGTEESFKRLGGTKPKAMHIATHGFYFTETEAEKSLFVRPGMELMTEGGQKIGRPIEDKSMTRSGLLFSGCNLAFRHEQIPEDEEDGILTAQEIAMLDLRGLDLVVLSACQTALGDVISGEGVFGLQRGFKKAGARTILMSLNKVDDEATRTLMVEFYKNLMNGKTKHQSLRDAQKHLRQVENGKYDAPKYWASFIMLDGLD